MRPDREDHLALAAGTVALAAMAIVFLAEGNGAAFLTTGICIAGIWAGRVIGLSGQTMLPVALGLAAVLYVGWFHPPGGQRATSLFAHLSGGVLAGYALAVTLRERMRWPGWGLVALAGVGAITVLWEIAEFLVDATFDTALIPSATDSALDMLWGCVGGAAAVGATRLYEVLRLRSGR
jgi:hypothetical protein